MTGNGGAELAAALDAALFSAFGHGLIRFVRDADEAVVGVFLANMVMANGGVFLPDGDCGHAGWIPESQRQVMALRIQTLERLAEKAVDRGEQNSSLREEADRAWKIVDHDAATIATLRAALDKADEYLVGIERGFEHWEADHPVTGEHLSGDPKVVFLSRKQWLEPTRSLREALAAAKEADHA